VLRWDEGQNMWLFRNVMLFNVAAAGWVEECPGFSREPTGQARPRRSKPNLA